MCRVYIIELIVHILWLIFQLSVGFVCARSCCTNDRSISMDFAYDRNN